MSLLGTIDRPGGFRHKAPYPRAVPPNARPPKGPEAVKPDTPLNGAPLGWPESPDDLFVDAEGGPVRIDKGFSWEHPLSAHGLMHNVITNAWRGDPYPIDTLLIFMANMAWNSHHEHGRGAQDAQRQARGRRIQDSLPGGLRRLPVGDDGLCRPGAARHHLPGAARLHVDARPADLRVRRAGGFGAHPGAAAHGPVPAVPGSAGRTGLAAEVPGLRHARRHAQVPRLPRLHRQLRDRARARASASWPAGAARAARSRCAASPTRSSGRCTPRTTASSTTAWRPNTSTCATGTRATWPGRRASGCAATTIRSSSTSTRSSCRASSLAAQGKRAGQAAAGAPAQARRDLLRPAALLLRAARGAGHRPHALPAERGDAAADGDVPLVGLAERLAAPDPHAQLPVRQPAGGTGCRHRRRRLDVGRIAMGQGALHVPLLRGGGARHRVDLERHRQGAGCLGTERRRQRVAARLPAQPPDQRGIARRGGASCRTPIRSPARPPGTTCACASARPRPTSRRRPGRSSRPCRPRRAPASRRAGVPSSPDRGRRNDPTGAGHRPECLRRLPCLRHQLQAVEHLRFSRAAGRHGSLRRRPERHLLQPRADLRGRRVPEHADRALPEELPALRRPALRAGVPHRRQLQARRRRHRARRLRQVHRLQVLHAGPAPTARASSTRSAR